MALLLTRGRRPQFKFRPQTFQEAPSITLPSPYGGINLRDDITALKSNEARVLVNWLPGSGQCEFRPGFDHHAAGMDTGEVKTLAAFVGYTSSKLLAGANGKIYDVTDGTLEGGNDSYTKVLLKFDGADAATTITDSNAGGSSHSWSVAADAQIDTAQSKFGGSSLLCDGTGDWVTTADHADYTLGTSSFTIELWARPAADGSALMLAGQADSGLAAATSAWYLGRNASNKIEFNISNGSAFTTSTSTTSVVAGSWFHIRVVRSSNTIYLFVNGALDDSDTFSGTVPNVTAALRVGAAGESTTTPWNGWIDEFAFHVGSARSTAAFTAPSLPNAPYELASGFTQDRWQTALYSDRLFFVNGSDNPQVYDGSTVAAIAWAGSGLTDNDLINIALVRNRLWFCESNKAHVWYGAVGQITAASNLTKFDLDQIASGGTCTAVGSWSVSDSGDGADDFTVFVMSTGEIIVYQGDPATTFALIGKYQGAEPIGRQCLFKVGGELIIITRLGYLPVSAAVRQQAGKALVLSDIEPWGKIAPGVAADAVLDAANAGWHGVLHLGVVYCNVPQSVGSLSKQWVLNTRTGKSGAWTNYSDWNASRFCSSGGELYFGAMADGAVYKVTGATDNGTAITAYGNGAFVFPQNARRRNLFTAIRPILQAEGTVTGIIGVDTDFLIRALTGASVDLNIDTSSGSAWETSAWETTSWGTAGQPVSSWYSITGEGRSVSARMRATSSTADVKWFATDLMFKPGGVK